MANAAAKYLFDLPSRGLFSAPVLVPSNPNDMRVYVCDHDTSPTERQIKTDPTNILVRSLRQNLGKAALKDVKYSPTMRRKRYSKCPHIPDDKWPAKRARLSGTAHLGQETPTMLPSDEDLRTFVVVETRTYLRESITRDG